METFLTGISNGFRDLNDARSICRRSTPATPCEFNIWQNRFDRLPRDYIHTYVQVPISQSARIKYIVRRNFPTKWIAWIYYFAGRRPAVYNFLFVYLVTHETLNGKLVIVIFKTMIGKNFKNGPGPAVYEMCFPWSVYIIRHYSSARAAVQPILNRFALHGIRIGRIAGYNYLATDRNVWEKLQ